MQASRSDGEQVVLKVGCLDLESRGEADALRVWRGNSAVRLLEAWNDDDFYALLLERCEPGLQLRVCLPEEAQDRVIASLLPNLWIEPSSKASFSSLAEMCEHWVAESESRLDYAKPAEEGLFRDAVAVWNELANSTTAPVLLHTDLHAGNVLASRRQPWLTIDPKPFVGDPAYDVLQHITNCPGRLAADPFALCERMGSLTQVSAKRVRLWLFSRLVIDPQWPFGATGSPTNYDVARLLKV